MRTLIDLYDEVAKLPSGGYLTADTRLNRPYVYSLIHSAAAKAKQLFWIKNRSLHQTNYIPFYPEYESTLQENNCIVRFKMPRLIQLDGLADGMEYLGSIRDNNTFIQVNNRLAMAGIQKDRILQPGRKNYLLLEGRFGEVHGQKVREFMMYICPADPTDIPTYNVNKDAYPLSEDLVPEMKKIILQQDLIIITKSFADAINNSKDDTAITKQG